MDWDSCVSVIKARTVAWTWTRFHGNLQVKKVQSYELWLILTVIYKWVRYWCTHTNPHIDTHTHTHTHTHTQNTMNQSSKVRTLGTSLLRSEHGGQVLQAWNTQTGPQRATGTQLMWYTVHMWRAKHKLWSGWAGVWVGVTLNELLVYDWRNG